MLWNDPGESAPGEDEFLAILFKNCKLTLALPLFLMWDYSFQNSRIESCNLSSIAAPIFKVESNLKPLNYPPVSLTSHIITIFKGFSKKGRFILGGQQRILNCQWHGFRKGCSCVPELLAHFDCPFNHLSKNLDSDPIYLDFRKAFDKVDHALLFNKSERYGINYWAA